MDALGRADAMHREAIAGLSGAVGPRDPRVLRAEFELVMCLIHENKFDESAALAARVERDARALGAGGEPLAALSMGLRSVSLIYSDADGGEALAESALREIPRVCGADHYVAALVTCTLGGASESRGDLEEAARRYREASASYARLLGESDPRTASRLCSLGRVLDGLGRYAEAEAPLRSAVAVESVGTPLAREVAAGARRELEVCLRGLGRPAGAEAAPGSGEPGPARR
jgi:tetratricopeptide (TPR) repeat protein